MCLRSRGRAEFRRRQPNFGRRASRFGSRQPEKWRRRG